MVKKGDTLIEVTIAVGIFSLIAIAMAAVLSSGTSGAQSALEITLAREEIDAQAEALRFIHSAYIADKNSGNTESVLYRLWKDKITANAITLNDDEEFEKSIVKYTPTSCSAIYDPQNGEDSQSLLERQKGFIINIGDLGNLNNAYYDTNSGKLQPATTFPRLVFNNSESPGDLIDDDRTGNLFSAEGIYVVAVADHDTTTLFDVDGSNKKETSSPISNSDPAFYDFYIRSCWYGLDTDTPSTISTVIRLHNPDVKTNAQPFEATIAVGGTNIEVPTTNFIRVKDYISKLTIPTNHAFLGFCTKPSSDGVIGNHGKCEGGTLYRPNDTIYIQDESTKKLYLYPVYREHFWVDVNNTVDSVTSSTSGEDGFYFKVFIDDEPIKCNTTNSYNKCSTNSPTDTDLIDFYQQVPDNVEVKFVFKALDGYYMSNKNTICSKIKTTAQCTISENNGEYTVRLVVSQNALATTTDSSGHYSIVIAPIWKKLN